jgi:hypothetical protein
MGMVMAVAVSMIARMVMRVGMAWAVGVCMHRYFLYSTSLRPRLHPKVSSCYWKL